MCGLWRTEKIIVNIFIIWTQLFQLCKKERAQWPQTETSTRPLCMSPLLSGTAFHFYLSVTHLGFLTPCALNLSQTMLAAGSHSSQRGNGTCSTASLCWLAVGSQLPSVRNHDFQAWHYLWNNYILCVMGRFYLGKTTKQNKTKQNTRTVSLPSWSCQSQNKSTWKGLSKLLSRLQSATATLLSHMWGGNQQNSIKGLPVPCPESQK